MFFIYLKSFRRRRPILHVRPALNRMHQGGTLLVGRKAHLKHWYKLNKCKSAYINERFQRVSDTQRKNNAVVGAPELGKFVPNDGVQLVL